MEHVYKKWQANLLMFFSYVQSSSNREMHYTHNMEKSRENNAIVLSILPIDLLDLASIMNRGIISCDCCLFIDPLIGFCNLTIAISSRSALGWGEIFWISVTSTINELIFPPWSVSWRHYPCSNTKRSHGCLVEDVDEQDAIQIGNKKE